MKKIYMKICMQKLFLLGTQHTRDSVELSLVLVNHREDTVVIVCVKINVSRGYLHHSCGGLSSYLYKDDPKS